MDGKPTRGGGPLDVAPSTKQEAYEAMKWDGATGIWTLEFVFMNVDEGTA
jgi:hypothetical protein